MTDSSPEARLHALQLLVQQWRSSAMVAGQYSVEAERIESIEASTQAEVLTACANELEAVLVRSVEAPMMNDEEQESIRQEEIGRTHMAKKMAEQREAPALPVPQDETNHHNALTCSYCNPKGLTFAESADSHTLPVVLGLTPDDLRAAGTACEAQGNIHDRMQAEEEGGATVQSTRGKHWHDLAVKFSAAWYAAQQSPLPVVQPPQEQDGNLLKPATAESFGLRPEMQPVVDELRRRMFAATAPQEAEPAIDTYTPILWVSMSDEQRYEEWIRLRQKVNALLAAPVRAPHQEAENE